MSVTTILRDDCISHAVCHHLTQKTNQRHNIHFGARVSVLKALLTGLNGGYDDHKDYKGIDIGLSVTKFLNSNQLKRTFEKSLDWLTDTYVEMLLNIIHYTWLTSTTTKLFKYFCQRSTCLYGIRYLWICRNTVDPLSAIKYATVKQSLTKMDTSTITKQSVNTHVGVRMTTFKRGGRNGWSAYTAFVVATNYTKRHLKLHITLTITSNVASKQTGNSPVHKKSVYLNEDGSVNLSKQFFSPGANPSQQS